MKFFKYGGFRWLVLLGLIAGCDLSASKSSPSKNGNSTDSARESTSEPKQSEAAEPAAADAADAKPEAADAQKAPQTTMMTAGNTKGPRDPVLTPKADAKPPMPVELPDLSIEVLDPEHSVSFRQQIVIGESCEMLDGCATQTGTRALMGVEFSLRNDGMGALDIGSPWTADIYQSSSCDQAYIPNLFKAELRDGQDKVVSSGSMATKCIETKSGSYTCGSQGLGAHEVSAQPEGSCNFLDVTDLAEGDYKLRVTVNPDQKIKETNYDNNTTEWSVHLNPAQMQECGQITCGASCCPVGASCEGGMCMLPDLRVNYDAAADPSKLRFVDRAFAVDSCELDEMCVGGAGTRRLLLFEGRLENWGPGDLDLGPQEGNPLFTYSECHGHYHTKNFASYLLRNSDGSIAAEGHKQGYCLSDMSRIDDPAAPTAERPPAGRTTPCNRLTAGYADVYDTNTPCQWIDVTGVAPGDYMLEVTINPDGHVAEVDTTNNTIQVPVTVPGSGDSSQ